MSDERARRSACVRVRAPPRDARWFVLGCWPAWRGRMGTAASAGMKLNWAPVSVWLSFTLPHFPPPRPPPPLKPLPPSPPFSSCCSRRLLRLHPHRNFSVPADPPRPPSSSLIVCGTARGIDWWSQPLVSPPSSYLLFSQTLTARWRRRGLAATCTQAHTCARRTSDVDALSHHSAGARSPVRAQA